MRKIFVLTGLCLGCVGAVRAQNMSSPYSVYGVGEIQELQPDRSSGMANTSMAILSQSGFLINKNPASLIGLDKSFAQVDLGIVGKTVSFKGNSITSDNSSTKDVTIKRISLSAKLSNHWASSVGFKPFSYVNYAFTAPKSIEGTTDTYNGLYEGNGGLHNVFWSNAVSIGKHVAMGLRANFIFGSINQIETLAGGNLTSAVISQVTNYYNGFRFEYGAIYASKLSKNWSVSLGGKVTTKNDLSSDKTLTVTEGSSVVQANKELASGDFTLPWQYDGGIALINKGRTTFTVDYSYGKWNRLNPTSSTYALVDNERLSAGFQLSNQVQRFNQALEKNYFQAGVFAGRSHLQVKGQEMNEVGGTVGFGGYLGRLTYNLAVEGGRRGTTQANLVRENYFQFTLSLSYREILYSKGRKYD